MAWRQLPGDLGSYLARIARRAVRPWALLYERRYAELVRLAFAVTSDSDLAEELAQEAFVRVWHSWRNIRDQQSAPTHLRATVVSLAGAAGPGRHCCPAVKNTTPPVLGADWVRELPWRDRADVRAVEVERPAWLRELGQPPTTVKGQRPIGRPSSGSSSTGNAALSPTPTDRSAPNRSAGIGSGAATTGSSARRSTGSGNDSASSGWSFAPQTRTGWAHGPGQDGTIDPRQAVVPGEEEENKGIRAAAGGPLLALNPVQVQAPHQGGGEQGCSQGTTGR